MCTGGELDALDGAHELEPAVMNRLDVLVLWLTKVVTDTQEPEWAYRRRRVAITMSERPSYHQVQ